MDLNWITVNVLQGKETDFKLYVDSQTRLGRTILLECEVQFQIEPHGS